MTIQERAILVSLKISQWSARKYDKRVTSEVHANHGASADSGRYSKHLLPGDAPTYRAITRHFSDLRGSHYRETLAWSDDNQRLLPIANQDRYRRKIEDGKRQTERLLDAFLDPLSDAGYVALRENARHSLNGLYLDSDYPTLDELRSKFSVLVEFSPVPSGEDFRVNLSVDVQEDMARELNSRVARATEGAMSDAWSRLYSCVEHLHERLAQPGAIFRDSLVTNVREVCDVLRLLNVTGSAELETMRSQVENDLSRYDPDTLRDNENLRSNVAHTAGNILQAMRGTRKIQFVESPESEVTA